MGVDAAKVKQRAEEEAQKAAARAAGGFSYWSPKGGKNRVRFMPPWKHCEHGGSDRCQLPECKTADNFCREIFVHWGIGASDSNENGQSFSCPVQTPHSPSGGSCPICVHVAQLRATKDAVDAEMANELRAKQRFYSNIVDLDDPVYTSQDVDAWKAKQDDKSRECGFKPGDTKVQVFSYGPMIFKDLLDIFCEVDISDLNGGHDVTITREGKDRETKYRTRAEFNPSAHVLRGRPINEALIDLDRLMPFAPPDQMQAALRGEVAPAVAAGKPVPALPAATTQPAAQPQAALPARQTAPAARPAPAPAAKPAPAPAAQPVAAAPLEKPADSPDCWHDLKTVNPADAECVGGQKGQDVYDPCPYFQSCQSAKLASLQPKPTPGRRTAAKKAMPTVPQTTAQPESVDDLEAEMRQSLNS
jgi:hypothetical protein